LTNVNAKKRAEFICSRVVLKWCHRAVPSAFDTWNEHVLLFKRQADTLFKIAMGLYFSVYRFHLIAELSYHQTDRICIHVFIIIIGSW